MMSEHDTAVVETPDFLLAALERAGDAVVIVDRDLHVSYLQRGGRTDLGAGPRRSARSSCRPSGARRIARRGWRRRDPRTMSPRSRSSARMAAGSVPRCRFRTSRSAVKAAASHSSATSPRRSCRRERMARAQSGCRQDQPRRRRHRPQSEGRLHQRRVYRDVRLFGRGSAGPAGDRTAGGPPYRPQDAGKVAALDRRGSRRRGGNPRLRQERRRDLDLGQRQGVPRRRTDGSNTCSRC